MKTGHENPLSDSPIVGYAQLRTDTSEIPPAIEFISVNKKFEEITGFESDQWLQKSIRKVLPGKLKNWDLFHNLQDILEKGTATSIYTSSVNGRDYNVQIWKSGQFLNCLFFETAQATEKKVNGLKADEGHMTGDEKQLVLNSISDLIIYLAPDRRVLYANNAALKVLDSNMDTLKGRSCYHAFFEETEICPKCPVEEAIRSKSRASMIKELPDGQIWDILATPTFDEKGVLTGIVEIIKDITWEKRTEKSLVESEAKYKRLTEKTGIVVWEYDIVHDQWTYISPMVKKILGYEPAEWTNHAFWFNKIHPEERDWAKIFSAECISKGMSHKFEYRFRRKDGQYIWLFESIEVEMSDGKPVMMWGSMKDVSEQKRVELALRKSEENLSITLNSIGDGVIVTDRLGRIDGMNPVAESLCGWSLAEIKGRPLQEIFNIINADTRQMVVNPVRKVLDSGKIMGLENHTILISKDGTERQIADSAAPIKNKHGEIQGVVLVFSDVSEKYTIQKKIEESEKKYRELITRLEQGFAVHEAVYDEQGKMVDYRFVEVNPGFEAHTGLKPEHVMGRTIKEVIPDIEHFWIDKYSKVVETGKPTRFEYFGKELDRFYEVYAYRNRENHFAVMITDISERKQFEQKVKDSDKIFNHSIDMLCMAGFDGYFKVLNPSWTRVLGWSEDELLSRPWIEFVHPLDRDKTVDIKSHIENGIEVYQFENRYMCKNNTVKWLSWNSFPYPEENIMFGVARDITLQKQMDNILKLSEEKYRLLFDKSPVGIIHFDNKGVITLCNEYFAHMAHRKQETVPGLDMMDLPDKRITKVIQQVLDGKMASFEGDYKFLKRHKSTPVRMIARPVVDVDGFVKGGIALVEDYTANRQKQELEKKVIMAQDAVKFKQQFLANMSHEIRTPLTGILGMIEILEQTELTETQLDYLVTLKHSGEN
jgi:PAS domain S-box-containing protein